MMRKANLDIAQSLLNRNLSIDHVAELMSERSMSETMNCVKISYVKYWKEQILFAIKRGELKA